jgi:hypothetical protein
MNSAGAVYVYYQVPEANIASVRRAVMALLSDLKASLGISGRLLRRRDDPGTWMEVYEGILDLERFERIMHEAVDRHGLNALLAPSKRHNEIFVADVLEPSASRGEIRCA